MSEKEKIADAGTASASSACSGFTVEPRWWPTTLDACPPGLFKVEGGFGFKTEYRDDNGPEAYCVESGEYFWGGTNDPEKRRNLIVTPVIIMSPNPWFQLTGGSPGRQSAGNDC